MNLKTEPKLYLDLKDKHVCHFDHMIENATIYMAAVVENNHHRSIHTTCYPGNELSPADFRIFLEGVFKLGKVDMLIADIDPVYTTPTYFKKLLSKHNIEFKTPQSHPYSPTYRATTKKAI